MKNKILKLIFALLICQAAGILGSFFTAPAISSWYSLLLKPGFNPPNWVFGPVWTALFLLMGYSLYLILISVKKDFKSLFLFYFQLSLNFLWSVIFFGLKSPGLAFLEILVLWVAIALTGLSFYKINKQAAYLLLPYLFWVSFAAVLNFSIWFLN